MATFTNTATLSYNGGVTNSNSVTGEILEVLSATKTVLGGNYGQGDSLTYVVSIVNSGTSAVTGVTVSDNLGAYTSASGTTVYPLTYVDGSVRLYSNGVLQTAPLVTQGPPLSFSGITVPAGGNVIVLYESNVNSYAPLDVGSIITNEATVSGTGIAVPITVDAAASAESLPELVISKAVSPETVVEDGQITYTFVIQNSGNTEASAADLVTVTDTFDPILSQITVTLDGVTLDATDYTYNTTTGEFATTPGTITVPAATYSLDSTDRWITTPGVAVLRVTGTV